MLLAVAPNPAIDHILTVPTMTVGQVHRATGVQLAPAGKGLNVARAARTLGCKALATGPLGGRPGQIVADLARTEGLPADWYWLSTGETRTCLLINHAGTDATVINEPGPNIAAEDAAGFAAYVKQLAQPFRAVAFAGSLPPGVWPAHFAALARSLAAPERTVYVDTSNTALAAILAAPAELCIKVNQLELAAGFGVAADNRPIEQTIEAGQTLLDRGAALVVVTLGSKGALAITPNGNWQAVPPPVQVVSTVGSGDSLLAGLAIARLEGQAIADSLAFGVACGSANAMSNLPGQFERNEVEQLWQQVNITRLD